MVIKKNNRSKVKRSKLKRVKRTVKRSLKRGSVKNTKRKKINRRKRKTKIIKRMKGGMKANTERREELEEFIEDSRGVRNLRKILKDEFNVPEDIVDEIGPEGDVKKRKRDLIDEIIRLESLRVAGDAVGGNVVPSTLVSPLMVGTTTKDPPSAVIIDPLYYHPWFQNQDEGGISYADLISYAKDVGVSEEEIPLNEGIEDTTNRQPRCELGKLILKKTWRQSGKYIKVSENMLHKLDELNQKIQLKCPELSLVLGKPNELKGEITVYDDIELNDKYLILCLYHNQNCISSIEMVLDLQKECVICVSINSRTKEEYSGRKYNKLLRAVVIILLENETNTQEFLIRVVRSTAENPISALLLIRDYDTEVLHKGIQIEKRPLSYKEITKLCNENAPNIRVPLTRPNIERAREILNLLLFSDTTITCSE